MAKSNHIYPSWVLEHRKPATELRFIRNKYYLYSVSSTYDPITRKTKKKTGSILGSIVEGVGFVPSGKKELKDKVAKSQIIDPNTFSVKEFGFTSFLHSHCSEISDKLIAFFPDLYQIIIYMAYCRIAFHSPLKRMDLHIAKSFLSVSDKKRYSDKDFSAALRTLGKNRELIAKYLTSFMTPNDHILVDMTNIFSSSNNMRYSKEGYNSDMVFDKQFNLLYLFSAKLKQPAFYKVLSGNIKDITGFQICLKESGIEDATIIADKGFYSESNFQTVISLGLKIIVPLRRDNSMINYSMLNEERMQYFKFGERYVWYVEYESKGNKIHLFFDEMLKISETKDYLDRIVTMPEEYTEKGFKERKSRFGTLAMITNIHQSSEEIYSSYKSRNEVEVMFDGYKNVMNADRTYMQNDDALEGYLFINHIALQWHYVIYNLLKQNNQLKHYSVTEFIKQLIEIKKLRINDVWHQEPIINRIKTMLEKLKISVP